ncbi:MAG: cupin domain-containing protein [Solirubrobacterales bacterium]|nr:cupin domain-containing protein [Solirubrobacterales bacterium]
MSDVNVLHPTWDAEIPTEAGVLRAARLARNAGGSRLAANLYELEPDTTVSPLHFHHANEELLFVLSGTPTLRRGEGDERTLELGEVVAFPVGPAGTHQIVNRSAGRARVLICATNDAPEVAEQVETGMLAVLTGTDLRLVADAPAITPP